jgi:hypothetical protein
MAIVMHCVAQHELHETIQFTFGPDDDEDRYTSYDFGIIEIIMDPSNEDGVTEISVEGFGAVLMTITPDDIDVRGDGEPAPWWMALAGIRAMLDAKYGPTDAPDGAHLH